MSNILQNSYSVDALSYDAQLDTIQAKLRIATCCVLPGVELDPNDSLETWDVECNFSSRRYSITDTTDHVGDVELNYAPLVLYHFVKAFEAHYYALGGEGSLGDVEPFRFTIDL